MTPQSVAKSAGLRTPNRCDLPYFAYGTFKPGELAFQQLKEHVDGSPVPAELKGQLLIRDGLPLLDLVGGDVVVKGYLLRFKSDMSDDAYEVISRFEPHTHYSWQEVTLSSPSAAANVLVGRRLGRGRTQLLEEGMWSFRLDPVFKHGFNIVRDVARQLGAQEFRSDAPDAFDWPRFFRLQMAYLLLWSGVERLSTIAYGPALEPGERLRRLSDDPVFQQALTRIVKRTDEVYDSRDPERRYHLDPGNPSSSLNYYYTVRSNLSHRGKGAWADGEIVRHSLHELLCVVEELLSVHEREQVT